MCIRFNKEFLSEKYFKAPAETYQYLETKNVSWINIDGLTKKGCERYVRHFNIHPLIAEDILSIGQRPKMDEINGMVYCLLSMLYFNEEEKSC